MSRPATVPMPWNTFLLTGLYNFEYFVGSILANFCNQQGYRDIHSAGTIAGIVSKGSNFFDSSVLFVHYFIIS